VVGTATEELLSPQEAAGRLGVSVYTVRRWIKEGKLRAFKPGKEYRLREPDLEEFLRAREVRPKAPRRSPAEPSFNDVLQQQRQSDQLKWSRALRVILGDLWLQWTEEAPQTPAEIRPLLIAMRGLVEQGVFDTSSVTDESELDNISVIMQLLRKLNDIANAVEEDKTAQQRRELLEALPGGLSA
jgi:excisionase family DNA binding protein